MQEPSMLMPGTQVETIIIHSPLSVLVAVALLAAPILYAAAAWRRGIRGRRLAFTSLGVAVAVTGVGLAVLLLVPSSVVDRRLYYGAWVNGTRLYLRFYGHHVVIANICSAEIELLPHDKLDSVLSYRSNGVGDPLAHVSMGYYVARDGRRAYVFVIGTKDVVVIDTGRGLLVVGGYDSPEKFYQALLAVRERLCGSRVNGGLGG